MNAEPKYPDVFVRLSGEDGNAGAIMGRVTHALRRAGYGSDVLNAYRLEATSGNFDNLLRVTMAWVETE
jgi:hypothetical protein